MKETLEITGGVIGIIYAAIVALFYSANILLAGVAAFKFLITYLFM